ncbi:MAG TPA: hypothetical protein VGK33_08855 [Chloroflexota bacterium]|jgi:hypothetical protein
MVRFRFLTAAAVALGAYGVLGVGIAAAMLVVGISTFTAVASAERSLESQRASLVESIRTVSTTLHDTNGATTNFQQSIDRARAAADQGSTLANSSATTFRGLGTGVSSISLFGLQPLAGLAPQFNASADQLQQLATQLGTTGDALSQNSADVQRVGGDLGQLQTQLDSVAASLNQPGVLGPDAQSLLPFQVAFYGMCLLVLLQSAFSIVAGIVLYRLSRALRGEPLFPHIARVGTMEVKTATTIDVAEPGRVRRWR